MLCTIAGALASASAQSMPSAERRITPSVFVGGAGVRTGLGGGRNLSAVAGLDLAFLPNSRFHPAAEYRTMYAVDKGGVVSFTNNLVGLKVSTPYGPLHPYIDLLAGLQEATYGGAGYPAPSGKPVYRTSSSSIFSLGGGGEIFATRHLALKIDAQIQRYSSPVTASGHLYSEVGTIGLTYVFHLGHKTE